jgi:hypothetical protein
MEQIQIVRKTACQFVYRGTLGAICRAREQQKPNFHPASPRTHDPKIQIVRKTASQLVFRGTLGAICRTRNNRSPIFNAPPRQIGMKLPSMLYIST